MDQATGGAPPGALAPPSSEGRMSGTAEAAAMNARRGAGGHGVAADADSSRFAAGAARSSRRRACPGMGRDGRGLFRKARLMVIVAWPRGRRCRRHPPARHRPAAARGVPRGAYPGISYVRAAWPPTRRRSCRAHCAGGGHGSYGARRPTIASRERGRRLPRVTQRRNVATRCSGSGIRSAGRCGWCRRSGHAVKGGGRDICAAGALDSPTDPLRPLLRPGTSGSANSYCPSYGSFISVA